MLPNGSAVEDSVKGLSTAREKLLTARFDREYPLLDTKNHCELERFDDRRARLRLSSAW